MRYLALFSFIFLFGCAAGYDVRMPKLPGPADNVDCQILRTDGSLEGTYDCNISGRYTLEEIF